ncbi:MAG: glycogen-debranching protein [Chlamydiales bacterium]
MEATFSSSKGTPFPLGATISEDQVNFALFSEHATKVTLCFLDVATRNLIYEIPLDPKINRTQNIWHVAVKGLRFPILYGYRLEGASGKPFNYQKDLFLTDPYAKTLKTARTWGSDQSYFPFAQLQKEENFDWQNVKSPSIQLQDLIVYEMHVRGFTQDPSSGVGQPGTFAGVVEKIPHLNTLGVNAVELMPVQEFNECEYEKINPQNRERLFNYWGYSTTHFFSPMNRFASKESPSAAQEFKYMVRELHRNGIKVILDIVFNHTGEKGKGSTYSFRGIDRVTYYLLDGKGNDTNYTGCGNTTNLNQPVMRKFVHDCLRYWALEMHVDGFRFDLASVMNRDSKGNLLGTSPLIESLTYDPYLSEKLLIAEPWDCGGAYQLGGFYSQNRRWMEWNGKFRDRIRSFVKNDMHSKNLAATAICGSEDVFASRSPLTSLNFITAHDGFTLYDLVSYNAKHNEANAEHNRDGSTHNLSWNCGAEGETQDEQTNILRARQIRNFMFILLVSQGIPMITMGDECAHTRKGNNNPWCHDNPLNWFSWKKLEEQKDFYRFVCKMIAFRKLHSQLKNDHFLRKNDIVWHGLYPNKPDWGNPGSFLAFTLPDLKENKHLYLAMNQTHDSLTVHLPKPPSQKQWFRLVDTSLASPEDFVESEENAQKIVKDYLINSSSCILLKAL